MSASPESEPAPAEQAQPSIAILAGEQSGDVLGAAIVKALQGRLPQFHTFGVTGSRMQAAGCESIASIDALSLMGISEVVGEIPRLMRLRSSLRKTIGQRAPACVIGIDAPDFNLGLEQRLRSDGLRTVHVVSPTVWAWRPGRTRTVAKAAELLLALFPFEPACYAQESIDVRFVGHPLADQLSPGDARAAREQLGLDHEAQYLAVLPGSRGGEVSQLIPRFVAAGNWLNQRCPQLRFVVPVAKPALRAQIEAAVAGASHPQNWCLLDGKSREVVTAADLVLVASGTAALECLLLGRPMVVSYRVSPLTDFLVRGTGMLKVDSVSLPNLLAGEALVPELLQKQATPEILGSHVYRLLNRPDLRAAQLRAFDEVATQLRQDSAVRIADAIAEMLAHG